MLVFLYFSMLRELDASDLGGAKCHKRKLVTNMLAHSFATYTQRTTLASSAFFSHQFRCLFGLTFL